MDTSDFEGTGASSTVGRDTGGPIDSARQWLLLDGNRLLIGLALSALVGGIVYALVVTGYVGVGSGSNLPTLTGSGLTSGLLTVLTVTLSINQLILSRVFGSTDKLSDRLSGTIDFRDEVERLADVPASPSNPAEFLALIGETIRDRTERVREATDGANEDLSESLDVIAEYADGLSDMREKNDDTTEVLSTLLGPGYADNLVTTQRLRNEYAEDLPEAAADHLQAVHELLKAVAVTRQFFKTLAIQQDLAKLSRMIVYFGLLAFVTLVFLTLTYTKSAVNVGPALRPWVTSVGLGVVSIPITVLVSYMLRVATVSLYSVSVGPFVPPEERSVD
ncbi:apolipoprotein A1/A4/E family protein [Halomarina litorea]|uniref:apolipoprotein A1/A4/E family protein n=1 Tax=Halomarina litorea TaxID=2961595 RepID=UPI0020C2C6B7|nr:apolipoprotein A1/A4/E family protein [Halomarina sp. BCD28]